MLKILGHEAGPIADQGERTLEGKESKGAGRAA